LRERLPVLDERRGGPHRLPSAGPLPLYPLRRAETVEAAMPPRLVKEGVLVAHGPVVSVMRADVEQVRALAAASPRRRARLCAHPPAADPLHEMLIVLRRGSYVRPHRHRGKSESFHVVEGALTVAVFDDDGSVREAIRLGEYGSGRPFFFRLGEPAYHTVLVESADA